MNTIIEVNQINYTENVIVNSSNLKEVTEFVKNLHWSYVIKGDVLIENTYKVFDIKRTKDVNTQCSWEKVITNYKSCLVVTKINGFTKKTEISSRETYLTNMKIKDLTWGCKKLN